MKATIRTIFFCMVFIVVPSVAKAACSIAGLITGVAYMASNPVINSAGVADGTVLFSTTLANTASPTSLTGCSGAVTVDYYGATGPYNTMASGIPGVGGRITWSGGPLGLPSGTLPLTTAQQIYATGGTFNWGQGSLLFELVKTGPMSAGSYALTDIWMTLKMSGSAVGSWMKILLSGSTAAPTITVKQNPTCSVSSPSIQVPMGTVTVSGFSGIGSTSAARSFNIGLTCSGGDAGVTTRINTTLTDQTNPANQSSTLSLSNDSTAGGIGIQILNGSTVLSYGPDSATVGNPNQWSAGTTGNGSFNIPLTARYVQTASTVTPGTANGVATFTMSYQ